MPEQIAATYRFYSWLRQGLLAGLSGSGASSTPSAGRLALPIRLRVNDRAPIDVNVQLYGPGDITGLDAREILLRVMDIQRLDGVPCEEQVFPDGSRHIRNL